MVAISATAGDVQNKNWACQLEITSIAVLLLSWMYYKTLPMRLNGGKRYMSFKGQSHELRMRDFLPLGALRYGFVGNLK